MMRARDDVVGVDPGGHRTGGGHQTVDREVMADQAQPDAIGRVLARPAGHGSPDPFRQRPPARTARPPIGGAPRPGHLPGHGGLRGRVSLARQVHDDAGALPSRPAHRARGGRPDRRRWRPASAAPWRRARSGRSSRRTRRGRPPVGEHVGMVPLGASQDDDVGPVRVEVAGVLVRLDDEVRAGARPGPSRAARRSARRQHRADERRRVRAGRHEHVREPARRRALAVRARRPPTSRRPAAAASAMTCCHASSGMPGRPRGHQLRVIGCDGGQRLGDREPVQRPCIAPRRGRVVPPVDVDPGGRERPR